MKKILPVSFAWFLMSLCLFSSCQKSDDPDPAERPLTKADWNWGYCKGTVNGEEIDIENERYESKVRSMRSGTSFDGNFICALHTGIWYEETNSFSLGITLSAPRTGVYYLTRYYQDSEYDSCISIVYDKDSEVTWWMPTTRYIPREDRPIRVEITEVIWESSMDPVVEAKLDGILYNIDNPQDSIVIDLTYGAR